MRIDADGAVRDDGARRSRAGSHADRVATRRAVATRKPVALDRLRRGEGDAALAATLQDLAQTLPWFVEKAFASAFGPIIGQRVADAGRRLLAFPEYAATRVGASLASYARDEAGILARGDEMRMLAGEAETLSTKTEALAMRIDVLAARIDSPAR